MPFIVCRGFPGGGNERDIWVWGGGWLLDFSWFNLGENVSVFWVVTYKDIKNQMSSSYNICSLAFVVTKFDEIFSGYQPHQVSVLNQCFKDHLGYRDQGSDATCDIRCDIWCDIRSHDDNDDDDDWDGPWYVGSIQTPDVADSLRRLHWI